MHPAGQAMRGALPGASKMAVHPTRFKGLDGRRGRLIGARPPRPVAWAQCRAIRDPARVAGLIDALIGGSGRRDRSRALLHLTREDRAHQVERKDMRVDQHH